jgi:hypothetical protein
MAQAKKDTPVGLFANYKFSITDKQQGEWQTFLRTLPEVVQQHPMWNMLHQLSYTQGWTERPEHELFTQGRAKRQVKEAVAKAGVAHYRIRVTAGHNAEGLLVSKSDGTIIPGTTDLRLTVEQGAAYCFLEQVAVSVQEQLKKLGFTTEQELVVEKAAKAGK